MADRIDKGGIAAILAALLPGLKNMVGGIFKPADTVEELKKKAGSRDYTTGSDQGTVSTLAEQDDRLLRSRMAGENLALAKGAAAARDRSSALDVLRENRLKQTHDMNMMYNNYYPQLKTLFGLEPRTMAEEKKAERNIKKIYPKYLRRKSDLDGARSKLANKEYDGTDEEITAAKSELLSREEEVRMLEDEILEKSKDSLATPRLRKAATEIRKRRGKDKKNTPASTPSSPLPEMKSERTLSEWVRKQAQAGVPASEIDRLLAAAGYKVENRRIKAIGDGRYGQ